MSEFSPLRRKILLGGAATVGLSLFPTLSFASQFEESPRKLALNNLHTGEELQTEYFNGRGYQSAELAKLNHLCRDFRRNESIEMDKRLFDQLSAIQNVIGCDTQVQIISGYRSPATNEMLRGKSHGGVAKKSLHMLGRAMDFRLEGVPLAEVRKAALSLKAGGVGYYPGSNFVHIDTGRVRFW
ncbi:YcbK family protein [Aliivibrio sp. S4TY2]|uniref:YcbK family protein n=1 Tax=unclassified Aliivibrio TaxID=2645654 RepID=UPI0023797E3A|nr:MULTISPECIES: YcbK family protein [unclassified Aliivibrio]MDD9156911.1 YcbK family protein [Aliivibrio sp. S4TY2]MDD9160875.1 YcbK family protein [Aliivibrio sp. S4TY1]MDD9164904.1 YcbK family protein [Aliivibrio sp. S4MY2]MDD9168821.1 YcbK family protein [Aliivibrio sp. S4MY4]MDD9185349.1 YcbK family protein [Aliivibrio sp. S4MY3]